MSRIDDGYMAKPLTPQELAMFMELASAAGAAAPTFQTKLPTQRQPPATRKIEAVQKSVPFRRDEPGDKTPSHGGMTTVEHPPTSKTPGRGEDSFERSPPVEKSGTYSHRIHSTPKPAKKPGARDVDTLCIRYAEMCEMADYVDRQANSGDNTLSGELISRAQSTLSGMIVKLRQEVEAAGGKVPSDPAGFLREVRDRGRTSPGK